MKKFYSFVAIVAVALASMCVCVSCEKDEPGNETPKGEIVRGFRLAMPEEIYEWGEVIVTVEQDGKTTDYRTSVSSSEETIKFTSKEIKMESFTGKGLSVKGIKSDASVTCVYVANENAMETMPEKIDVVLAYQTEFTDGSLTKITPNVFTMKGMAKEQVAEYINKRLTAISSAIMISNPFEEKK